MLTDAALEHLKPKEKVYKVTDRDGMYVLVKPSPIRRDGPSSSGCVATETKRSGP
jgi:hypothetical protein